MYRLNNGAKKFTEALSLRPSEQLVETVVHTGNVFEREAALEIIKDRGFHVPLKALGDVILGLREELNVALCQFSHLSPASLGNLIQTGSTLERKAALVLLETKYAQCVPCPSDIAIQLRNVVRSTLNGRVRRNTSREDSYETHQDQSQQSREMYSASNTMKHPINDQLIVIATRLRKLIEGYLYCKEVNAALRDTVATESNFHP